MAKKAYSLEIDVNYDGAFIFQPLRYEHGRVLPMIMSKMRYEEFHDYIEKETGTPFTGIYVRLPGNEFENGLIKIQNDSDYNLLFDLAITYGKQVVYLDHFSLDLTDYLYNSEVDNGDKSEEGDDKSEEGDTGDNGEEGDKVDEQCETGSESDENDVDYDDGIDDEDTESVASLDHLSEGEDELLELRKGNPIAKIPLPSQLPQLGRSKKKPGCKDEEIVTIQSEHDDFMKDLLKALRGDGDEPMKEDPFKVDEVGEKFPIHDPTTHWKLKRPQVSERYEGPKQLKECLSYYALSNGFSLWYERSCKKSIIARCGFRPPRLTDIDKGKMRKGKRFPSKVKGDVPACTFRCYARWMRKEASFQIMSLVDEHTCARNFKYGSLIDYKWIGKHFSHKIRQNPEIRLVDIADMVLKKYKCMVSPNQCKRARSWALNEYERTLEEHYGMLRSYGDALLRSNSGSTVQLGVTPPNPDGKSYFQRFYVCLFGLKEGWKLGCRRVIALDGCFLKHTCKGELLTAVGRDGNNHIFPVAWAVVNVENKDNWMWFLKLLEQDLDMPEGHGLTLISDQHKGLIEAVKETMPHSEHRQCARHIYENFRKKYSGVEFRNLFWKASKSSYPAWFEKIMSEIRNANPNAYKYLIDKNPKTWSRAFFELHRGCEAVENGFSECFNSVLVKVRHRPIITMLEAIRVIIMERMNTMRQLSDEWTHEICPSIKKKLDWTKDQIRDWCVIHAGAGKFEVRKGEYSFTVDEEKKSCTCRMWELSGLPCTHGVAAIFCMNRMPEDYVPAWFKKDNYQLAYTQYLIPVDGMDTWPPSDLNKPLPPKPKRMPGRPKKKRQRAAHEPMVRGNKVTKHGVQMTCQTCLQKGHNKTSCKSEKRQTKKEPKKKSVTPKKKSNKDVRETTATTSNRVNASVPTSCDASVSRGTGNVSSTVGVARGEKTVRGVETSSGDETGKAGHKWITSGMTVEGVKASLAVTRGRGKAKRVAFGSTVDDPPTQSSGIQNVKQVTPTKRAPSERITKQKLAKRVVGHGSSKDDCMVVD